MLFAALRHSWSLLSTRNAMATRTIRKNSRRGGKDEKDEAKRRGNCGYRRPFCLNRRRRRGGKDEKDEAKGRGNCGYRRPFCLHSLGRSEEQPSQRR